MANEKWSQKPLITEISNTTEFCILDEAVPKNKRINAKTILDAKANQTDLIAQQTALDLKAPKENAEFTGTMKLNGVPIGSNDLNGTNYLMVYGVGTPTDNALELEAAYEAAKVMPRYLGSKTAPIIGVFYKGQTYYNTGSNKYFEFITDAGSPSVESVIEITEIKAKSTCTTLIVAPGRYKFSDNFELDIPSIHIASLTGECDVIIEFASTNKSLMVMSDYVNVTGLNTLTQPLTVADNLAHNIFKNCKVGDYSFGYNCNANATYINCQAGNYSFGGGESGNASGNFTFCKGGHFCFGVKDGIEYLYGYPSAISDASHGNFTDCEGRSSCFGANEHSTGIYIRCKAGADSFGRGAGGTHEGEYYYCIDKSIVFDPLYSKYCIGANS